MSLKTRLKRIGWLRYIMLKHRLQKYAKDKRSDEEVVEEKFLSRKGRAWQLGEINPDFTMASYDDKLAYIMIHDDDQRKTICADKVKVRDYVAACGYEDILIKPFYTYPSTKAIDFGMFEEPMIIKCNHLSGNAVKYYPGSKVDKYGLKSLDLQLKYTYDIVNRERCYAKIEGCILAEKMLISALGEPLLDYKFFCFDGQVLFMTLDSGVVNERGEHNEVYHRNFFDRDFNPMPDASDSGRKPLPYETIKRPKRWNQMVEIAERLSSPFTHCRVDLYHLDDQIYFGEITFYHGGAMNDFKPESLEKEMARRLNVDLTLKGPKPPLFLEPEKK